MVRGDGNEVGRVTEEMKQHITVEQFDTLSAVGKEKLKKWWHTLVAGDSFVQDETNFYPLLSIGQMIELIADNQRKLGFKWPGESS